MAFFQVMLKGTWYNYNNEENKLLKRAYNAGVTNIKFQCRSNSYVYDFERMVQINAETRVAHAIRTPEDWKPPSRPWVSADSVWAPARWMKAMFDADLEGAAYVPALDTKVSFFEATPSDGKKHIRWSVDEHQVQQLFGPKAGHTEVVSTGIEETDGPKESQPSLSRSESFRALQQRRFRSRPATAATVRPAYQDGELVEYYSTNNNKWTPAKLKVKILRGGHIVYSAIVGFHTQKRLDVPLDVLRWPLQQDELVQVFSKLGGGTWLDGKVRQHKGCRSVALYDVQLVDGRTLPDIPASRLRRRFCVGEVVEVYRGPNLGWMSSIVDKIPEDQDVSKQDVADRASMRSTISEDCAETDSENQAKSNARQAWYNVFAEDGTIETQSSLLLRRVPGTALVSSPRSFYPEPVDVPDSRVTFTI